MIPLWHFSWLFPETPPSLDNQQVQKPLFKSVVDPVYLSVPQATKKGYSCCRKSIYKASPSGAPLHAGCSPRTCMWPEKTNLICTHCGLGELSGVSHDVLGSSPKDLRTSLEHRLPVLWDVRPEGSHRTNLKPTESRWRHIFVGPVWIPGGFCSNTSLLCPPCPAGSLGPQPGNSPSYPPAPHSWRPAAGRACWSDLSQSHSPGHGWCQLSPPPVGYKKITWNLKNTTWKYHSNSVTHSVSSQPGVFSPYLCRAVGSLVRISTDLGTAVWAELGCHIPGLLLLGPLTAFTAVQEGFAWCKKRQSLSQTPSFLRRSTTLCKAFVTSNFHTSQASTWLR